MAKGAAWMVGMRLVIRGIGMGSIIVLARLLVPEDFGLVALATMLAGLLETMSDFSFDTALIRDQSAGRKHYDTAWTLSLLRGVVLAVLLVAFAVPAAQFFEDARIETIIYWLALATFIESFQNVGVVDFRKHMEFHKDFWFMTAQKLASVTVGIVLAYFWRDYWALVVAIIVGKFARVLLSFLMHPYRPRLCLSEWHGIFHFTKWLLANNVLFYLYLRADTLIIGKLLGAQTLGIYSLAYEVSNLATTELISPIRRALFPGFAKLATDREKLNASVVDTLALIALIGAPIAVGIGLTADLLVPVLLGDKWLDAIPLIEILAIYGLLQSTNSATGPAYLALGRPQYLTALTVVSAGITIPLLIFGINKAGAPGAAIAITVAAAITLVLDLAVAMRLMGLGIARVVSALWRTAAAVAVMVLAVLALKSIWPADQGILGMSIELGAAAIFGALVYFVTQFGLWRLSGKPAGAERLVLTELRRVLP